MSIEPARLAAAPAPSLLLRHLAGEAADAIALVWPAPHSPYLTATSDRRHLIGVALALRGGLDPAAAVAALELPMRRAIPRLLHDPAPGLARALGRMGEQGWPLEAYRQLVLVLRRPGADKLIRHGAALAPEIVGTLVELPPELVEAGLAHLCRTRALVELAAHSLRALAHRDGPERVSAFVRRMRRCRKPERFFHALAEELAGEPQAPPFASSERVRWLATRPDLHEAASRYRNCLRGCVSEAATGESVFGEWLQAPGYIVQVSRDPIFGWSLRQARGFRNAMVPSALRGSLRSDLEQLGVNTGPSGALLHYAASAAAIGDEHPWRDDRDDAIFGDYSIPNFG
ncbi:MAG TPA: hypothetical protein VG248_19640 [Caulobacteraceae bacterium]|jgi:hypothetical protein|nr:hypothetical protein [Caulobacteraceae bacterium]